MPEVHSTAAEGEGVVSRTDKFGHSMPILRPTQYKGQFTVHHENEHRGYVQQVGGNWYATKPGIDVGTGSMHQPLGPHESKHTATASLFDRMDPATYGERHR
jgi:hypothetical protein